MAASTILYHDYFFLIIDYGGRNNRNNKSNVEVYCDLERSTDKNNSFPFVVAGWYDAGCSFF
jgi:hypothetical protein